MSLSGWRARLGLPADVSLEVWGSTSSETNEDVARADAGASIPLASLRARVAADPGWRTVDLRPGSSTPWAETAVSGQHRATYFIGGAPETARLEGSAWREPDGVVLSRASDAAPGLLTLEVDDAQWFAAVDDNGELVILQSSRSRPASEPSWIPPPSVESLLAEAPLRSEFSSALEAAEAPPEHGLREDESAALATVVRMGWLMSFLVEGVERPMDAVRHRPGPRLGRWWRDDLPEWWASRFEEGCERSASKLLGRLLLAEVPFETSEALLLARWRLRLYGAHTILCGFRVGSSRLDELLGAMDDAADRFLMETDRPVLEGLPHRGTPSEVPEDALLHAFRPEAAGGVPLEVPWWIPSRP